MESEASVEEAVPNGPGPTEVNGAGDSCDFGEKIASLEAKVSSQQAEIDELKRKLESVSHRLEAQEQSKVTSRVGPIKALAPPKSAPPSRRQTLDPRQIRSASQDNIDGTFKKPLSTSRRIKSSRDKLASVKDEPGMAKMYLKGRPVTFLLPENYTAPAAGAPPPEAPEKKLQLDWAYGYRGKDCRNNLYILGSGELLFFTAAVCVVQDATAGSQRFYLEHTDDVKCIAVHPDKKTVASGQVAGHEKPTVRKDSKVTSGRAPSNPNFMPHIRIWNSETLETLKVIGAGTFDRALACVSFSSVDGGALICAVDEHNDHRLSVWDWNKGPKGTKLAEMKASQDAVFQADFHPTEKNQIVCCGKNQLSFWTLDGKTLKKQMAVFEKNDKPKFITCFTFNEAGDVITGDSNGNIFVWPKGSNKIGSVILEAHDGVIFYVGGQEDGTLLSGGGRDRTVKKWDMSNKEAQMNVQLPEEFGAVRVIATTGENFFIGTNKNMILSGVEEPTAVVKGHCGELWGLTEDPTSEAFFTCAYDNLVKKWSSSECKELWTIELPKSLHCIAHHPTVAVIAIGTRTPDWYIYSSESQEKLAEGSCGSEQLECIEFSPNGELLAIGSRDNYIYIYKFNMEEKTASLVGKCQGHTSYVTHIDWSKDSAYLKSNSGDYEVLYWDAANCKQLTDGDKARTLEWATQNCTLSLETIGMWPGGADGTDINGCCKSHSEDLLVSADDFGQVNMFKYPSMYPGAKCHHYRGHSSHVTSVRFLHNDSRLLSCGGKDSTVLQWRPE